MSRNQTEERIRYLLDKITYKAGWKLEIAPRIYSFPRSEWESIGIVCTFTTADVDTGKQIKLNVIEHIGPFYYEVEDGTLIKLIARIIQKFEEHEFREWFKVDGFCVYDPHPEEKRQTYQLQGFQA